MLGNMANGLREFIKKILKIFNIYFAQLFYFEVNLDKLNKDIEVAGNISIKEVNQTELLILEGLVDESYKSKIRFSRSIKSRYFFAYDNDKIIGFIFLNEKYIVFERWKIKRLSQGGSFIYCGYIFPEYRGKKIFEKLVFEVYKKARKEKKRFCCCFVSIYNKAAIKCQEKFSYNKIKVFLIHFKGINIIYPSNIGGGHLIKGNI
jgi:ribosomal protein S18 acetylase RimI-like enzyme